MSIQKFRSALHGFNRQDVIQYIESTHREYAAQLKKLRDELEQERGRRADVEERSSLANEAASASDKDALRAKEELAQALDELRIAQDQRDDLQLRLRALERDYAELQAAAERMAPAARAYEALKDKAASIELDAHNRAQTIIKEGESQASQIRQEVKTWLVGVENSYDRLKADVAATLAHAVAELDRTGRSLEGVTRELDVHGTRLQDISAGLDALDGEADHE